MMALRTSSGSDFIRTIFAASIATSVPAPMAMPMLHALFEVCRRQAPRSGGVPGSGIRLQRRLTTEGQADGAVRHEQDADVLRWRQAEVAGVRIGNVRSAQEVERESADAIEQRQQREKAVL